MAISNLSLVNQKLAYARTLLKSMSALSGPGNAAERLSQHAVLDAAVFHLVCGYQHYLRELAENYRVKNIAAIAIEDEKGLLEALSLLEKVPSEATELELLRQQSDTWLRELHDHYDSLWRSPVIPAQETNKPANENLIHLVVLNPSASAGDPITLEKIKQWERSFTALVERQRETSSEY